MSKIDNDNYNRLEISPLIEENMSQMKDSEFSISQLTGHITLKREDKYISKTKELQENSIDIKSFIDDLNTKKEELENRESLDDKIEDIEGKLDEAKKLIEEMYRKLEKYEEIAKKIDKDLNELDDYIVNNLLPKISSKYGEVMSSNIKLLGNLLIQYELLDIIIDNEKYFNDFVKQFFKYTDRDGNILDYGVIQKHEENKVEMDKRVFKRDYEAYVNDLHSRYNTIKNKYGLKGDYIITGWS